MLRRGIFFELFDTLGMILPSGLLSCRLCSDLKTSPVLSHVARPISLGSIASIPVSADDQEVGEIDVAVNFGGVTFLPDDHLYADTTGIILSPEPLDLE